MRVYTCLYIYAGKWLMISTAMPRFVTPINVYICIYLLHTHIYRYRDMIHRHRNDAQFRISNIYTHIYVYTHTHIEIPRHDSQ